MAAQDSANHGFGSRKKLFQSGEAAGLNVVAGDPAPGDMGAEGTQDRFRYVDGFVVP